MSRAAENRTPPCHFGIGIYVSNPAIYMGDGNVDVVYIQ